MKPLDPKDEEIARLKAQITELQAQVKELQSRLIEQMNYSLQLDRELQTGETNVLSDANHHTDPTPQRP